MISARARQSPKRLAWLIGGWREILRCADERMTLAAVVA
jgi:hypothetical protein